MEVGLEGRGVCGERCLLLHVDPRRTAVLLVELVRVRFGFGFGLGLGLG